MADAPTTPSGHVAEPKNFEPKTPVQLNPPKHDPISVEELAKCDGMNPSALSSSHLLRRGGLRALSNEAEEGTDSTKPTLVAIKGTVFDVSKNKAYGVGGQYHGKRTIPPLSLLPSPSFLPPT
ncbi:MAG: hypothetical protein Q9160_007500 [Pyrenula sp. 1 TL-2023]